MPDDKVERILTVIAQIPRGKVATYGQIARLAGIPRNARQVGRVLRELGDSTIAWYRVVNSKGEISRRNLAEAQGGEKLDCESIHRQALEEENVEFDARGRIPLERFLWQPTDDAQ